jgi:hypothetical protein
VRIVTAAVALLLAGCAIVEPTPPSRYVSSGDGVRAAVEGLRPQASKRYALILGAGPELRHIGNMSLAYQVMLSRGYEERDIFVLAQDVELPYLGYSDQLNATTLSLLLAHLNDLLDGDDTLVVYVTGHGDYRDQLIMADGSIVSMAWLAQQLAQLRVSSGLLISDVCYWDASVSFGSCNWTWVTVADDDRTTEGNFFARSYWKLLRGDRALSWLDAISKARSRPSENVRVSSGCGSIEFEF